ncbi:MAG: sensor domain-containing diguanylate cyclase [Clostridiales bacterium]|nr:sensor domain-containing diguanylate cyclase [Clostridiales bacterium]
MEPTGQEYRTIVENAPNLIWRAGVDAKCDYFNKTWLSFTGHSMEQEQGDGWASGVYPDDLDRCVQTYLENFHRRTPFEMEYRLRRADGEWRWINDRGVPFYSEQGEFAGYIGSCVDVTDKVEGYLYKEMAQKDSLTGVLSRQYLMGQLQRSLEQALRQHSPLTVAMLDIDSFKHINDRYGHLTGDSALRLFTGVLQRQIRESDLLGRFGGDEFVIVFRYATIDAAKAVIERIVGTLRQVALKTDADDIVLTMSAGLSDLADGHTVEQLLQAADRRMYQEKLGKQPTPAPEE